MPFSLIVIFLSAILKKRHTQEDEAVKRTLAWVICVCLMMNLAGCRITIELPNGGGKMEIAVDGSGKDAASEEASVSDAPSEPDATETASPDTESEPTAPSETEPIPTEAVSTTTVLADAMYEKVKIRTEEGATMYVGEHVVASGGSAVLDWRYLDFDQDGQSEIFVETDSMYATYMILHWNGAEVRCYDFGHLHIQELKENGYMAGANSASSTVYYWVSFGKNGIVQHTLAEFDTDAKRFLIGGVNMSEADANAFLREWNQMPNVIGSTYDPPEETQAVTCAVCGRGVDQNFNWTAGLCGECSWYYGRCVRCGRISADLYEGVCEVCEPYGGLGEPLGTPGFCLLCNQSHYSTIGGACDNCRLPGGQCCNQCGIWTNQPVDGYCPNCKAWLDNVEG